MRTSSLVPGFALFVLLVLLAAACGDGEPAPRDDGHEIRPTFTVGDRYRVRDDRSLRIGAGRFPPAADLEARTKEVHEVSHIYDEEVVEADGHRLFRVRRTYLTSTRGGQPTPVAGKTYQIVNPYPLPGSGPLDVRVEGPGGSFVPASRDEIAVIAAGAARLATTLLPDRKIREDETWPGRDLPTLDLEPSSRRIRLESIEPGRAARVTWQPSGRLAAPGESSVSMKETLTIDLAGGRIGDFHSRTEHQQETPVAQWRRIVIEVSAVVIE
ncbi:MAG: hypothetical protein ABFS86_07690 [Planctomycetota bacterium]